MPKITVHGGASHDPWPLRGGQDPAASDVDLGVDVASEEDEVEIPAGNASTDVWRSFVRHQHPQPPFDIETASRNELREWFEHGAVPDVDDADDDDAANDGGGSGPLE